MKKQNKKTMPGTGPMLIKKLRTQNKRLETILHISPAAFMIARAKDRALTEVNEAWTSMLGYAADDLIGQSDGLSRLFRDNGAFSAILRNLDSGGDISNLRCYLHDAYNKPRIVQLYATRFEETGDAYYLFNFCDLTESLSNEKTVLAYDHKIRNLERALDASSLISVTDAQGMIIYANAKFCEVSEYTRDELLGQNHRIINSGHHSADFMRNLWQTIRSGKVWHGEIRNRKKSGGLYWVQSTIIPFLDKNGTPYQFYAIRQEISEHKLFQEKLMRTQAALMQAQELAHIGTWEWYPETDNPLWSPELFRIFRLEPGDSSIGLNAFKNFSTPRSYETLEKAIQIALQTGEAFNTECEVVRADKTLAWVVIAGLPLYDDHGKISGLRGSVQDITERKLIEEKKPPDCRRPARPDFYPQPRGNISRLPCFGSAAPGIAT
jgi:PAS domain S-box-containing protein